MRNSLSPIFLSKAFCFETDRTVMPDIRRLFRPVHDSCRDSDDASPAATKRNPPRHAQKVPRLRGIDFKILSQVYDEVVDRRVVGLCDMPQTLSSNSRPRDHDAFMLDEVPQQFHFQSGQANTVSAHGHLVGVEIHVHPAAGELEARFGRGRRASDERAGNPRRRGESRFRTTLSNSSRSNGFCK